MDEDSKKKAKDPRQDQENAEKKLESLYEKRNTLNEEAKAFREERNQLNEEKRRLFNRINELKATREQAFQQLTIHKNRRNNYQNLARELIKSKRAKAGDNTQSMGEDVLKLRDSVRKREEIYETTPMSIEKEREALETLRRERRELMEKEKVLLKQQEALGIIDDINTNINEVFGKADAEHEMVQKHYADAREYKKEMDAAFDKVKEISGMADRSHQKFITCRKRADDFHEKAMEMKQAVMSIRQQTREERKKARELINEQNRSTRNELENKEKLEEKAEETLKDLLKGGKIQLNG